MEVEVIKANNPFDESSKVRKIDRLRVAAYCRVSTDDEDQIKSYNSMVKYYTDLNYTGIKSFTTKEVHFTTKIALLFLCVLM